MKKSVLIGHMNYLLVARFHRKKYFLKLICKARCCEYAPNCQKAKFNKKKNNNIVK